MLGDYIGTLPGKKCSSCGRLTHEYVEFKCPRCGQTTFVRCHHCRETYTPYKCLECGFEGP